MSEAVTDGLQGLIRHIGCTAGRRQEVGQEEWVLAQPVFTIGHSTRPLEQFIDLLQEHGVTLVADVRTVPRSRHNPQFNRDALPESLVVAGIGYRHLAALGGLRRTSPDSPNTGWRNASFRGFADYMQTVEFAAGLDELLGLAQQWRVVIMCAEAVPWRCHRSLIADALFARGVPVDHIISAGRTQGHRPTPFARIEGHCVTYPIANVQEELVMPHLLPGGENEDDTIARRSGIP